MEKQHLLIVIIVACILNATSSAATRSANLTADATTSVYDVLLQNNLPPGLLPLGVQSYVLHPVGALEFRYASSVSGNIKSGSISRVSGVRLQVEFAWLGFNEVSRAGDMLNIQLEKSTQSFPVSAFAQSARSN
ncbi:hypothetical protein HU200_065292 [Digitaria exilis]|uniref:Uncharacterized protein n=1 Tax=Digitaria exilis TaxID=1010633 RepID=A0A835A454_9POAL|nr:hypothetical protein HU200_065292 [Digitaria exilis]